MNSCEKSCTIKTDGRLHTLALTQGMDGLDKRCAEYYKQGARFAKWRSVVSIPNGPSTIAVRDCAYGLARYAAIAQVCVVCLCLCVFVCE